MKQASSVKEIVIEASLPIEKRRAALIELGEGTLQWAFVNSRRRQVNTIR